jgi:demethylmenaquinone methyltransferase/2-methoxy-6-polyprenyl-1,4-benzoquinol methylase
MTFDHFNLIAGVYDRAGQFQVSELLAGLLDVSPDSLLLDAGGGTGRVAAALCKKVRDVFVADISRGMLRRAAGKGLATVCAPAESLPFHSRSFDRIVMVDALHHVIDQRQAVRELFRLLAPGGRIVIVEPDIRKPGVKLLAIGEKALLMRSHFLNGEKIAVLFADPEAKTGLYYEGFNVICIAERVKRM